MGDLERLLAAATRRAAQHLTGRPLSDLQRDILRSELMKGKIVGVHSREDGGLVVLIQEGRPRHAGESYLFALREYGEQGDLRKGGLAGSRPLIIGEFERRTGQTFGHKDPRVVQARPNPMRDALDRLMQAVRERHAR